METKEIKHIGNLSIRSIDGAESRTIVGCAVKFDSLSQYLGYYEEIKNGAITEDTIKNSDIFALFNHDEDKVLARSRYGEGSLKLELRNDGLYYEFEAPKTAAGDELIEHIKRGEITSSSFAFTVAEEGGDRWYKTSDGELHRDILIIDRLYDVSPVYEPAYLSTSCSKRAKEMIEKNDVICAKMDAMMAEMETFLIK